VKKNLRRTYSDTHPLRANDIFIPFDPVARSAEVIIEVPVDRIH
jgi:hypothetical protein